MKKKILLLLTLFSVLVVAAGYAPGNNGLWNPLLELRKHNILGHSTGNIVGYDSELANGTEQTIWPNGTVYSFLSAAVTLNVYSDSVNDTSTGTGALHVLVDYLDANYAEGSEIVTMAGHTGVATTASILRVNGLRVLDVGTVGEASGNIYLGDGAVSAHKPANVYGMIASGDGVSRQAVYTVPAGKTLYVQDINLVGTGNKLFEAWLDARNFGQSWTRRYHAYSGGSGTLIPGVNNGGFTATTDLRWQAIAAQTGNAVSLFSDYTLVNEGDTNRNQ